MLEIDMNKNITNKQSNKNFILFLTHENETYINEKNIFIRYEIEPLHIEYT